MDITHNIVQHFGVISTSEKGWTTELNLVSWNGKDPKYDIRAWSPDHTRMGKGISLTEADLRMLFEVLYRNFPIEKTDTVASN